MHFCRSAHPGRHIAIHCIFSCSVHTASAGPFYHPPLCLVEQIGEGEIKELQQLAAALAVMRDEQMRVCAADVEARTRSFHATRACAELANNRRLHRLEHFAQLAKPMTK